MGINLRALFASRGPKPARAQRKLRRSLQMESLEGRRLMTAAPYGASDTDLGEFLLGTVAVTPVFLESNGQLDASTEDWSQAHIDEVLANIDTGLDWWVDTLATKTSIHELEFTIDDSFASTPAETKYEPISRRSNDYSLYVSEFLAGQGFSSGTLETNILQFNQAQRVKHGTDWSFTMFVVPSQNDSDGNFASGGSFSRAFAFAGGLFMIVPSTRPASTFTHETGHIFWARDEYAGGGSYFARRGYYNTQNENAANNPDPGFVQQPSIMASGTLLETAYDNHISPDSTLAMLGWQDSDNDGIFDVLDVPHQLTGSGYHDLATGTYKFTGEAVVGTLPNLNSSGNRNDITLNLITQIEYRFDGGEWQVHSSPGTARASLNLSINAPSNATEIEIRARDDRSTVVSNVFSGRIGRADATPVTGINGHVWIDANKNQQRDINEFGAGGWTVEVVDGSGTVLDLQIPIEPDDFPDGVLASDFSPHLTLASVGTDADGRVGVFSDTATSTGTKTFRGFSRNASSYMPTWTDASRLLQANFSSPTSVVEIDAIGANSSSYGRLEAFNSSGELIGRYTTGQLGVGEVETMRIASGAADIAYINAGGHASTSIRLDNLLFGPETSTTTNSLGGYALGSLPAGQYNVLVTPIGSYRDLNPSSSPQQVTVVANQPTLDVDFGFENTISRWQNPVEPLDVDNDGFIAPIDVLLVINDLNAFGSRDLRDSNVPSEPYLDVNGDSFTAAIDVLLIINHLNSLN